MTHRTDVARGRDIVARWCALAEQRLDHLTDLYETGRWRRYHSESSFLENIREARCAVDTWRGLLNNEATVDNLPVDLSWLGRGRSALPAKRERPIGQATAVAPRLAELAVAPPVSVVPAAAEPEPQPAPVLALDLVETAEESTFDQTLALTLDIVAMAERYPLLRNAFQSNG